MSEQPPRASDGAPPSKDYSRQLGVVECLVAITNECPRGHVRAVANQALEAIKQQGSGVMRDQVYYVLTAIQGWRGERARQVHESLTTFYHSTPSQADDGAEDEG